VLNGGIVLSKDGDRVRSVEQVFLNDDTCEPAFVTVRTGLVGMSETFVPLAGATLDGSRIHVAYARDRMKNGPRIDSDLGSISTQEENALYLYYGIDTSRSQPGNTGSSSAEASPAATGRSPNDGPLRATPPSLPRPR
jgi:hypothetical protein